MFFLIFLGLPVTTFYAQAATINIYCPKQKVRTEITTPLPSGWWQTPQVGSLLNTEVKNLAGKPTIFCKYWAYGRKVSVMKKVPRGYICHAVNKHIQCTKLQIRPAFALSGTWYGTANTRSMTKLKIYKAGSRVKVHAWGKCHPSDCNWGVKNAYVINSKKIEVFWDQGFVRRRMVVRKVGLNRVKVRTFSHYADGSGRADKVTVEYMHKQHP